MLRTESQQKEICSTCSMAKTADLIGDSCTLLIIRDLFESAKYFGDFEASLPGISTRTLANKLKALEKSGVIARKALGGKPPRVEYSLTKKGIGLRSVTAAMTRYGEKYLR
jgi:DNA-binding HxlR family transcriptional regulator